MTARIHQFPDRGYERFVSKQDVARHLGFSTRWVELRMERDGLPWHPPAPGSNRRRFRLSEIDRWMEAKAA